MAISHISSTANEDDKHLLMKMTKNNIYKTAAIEALIKINREISNL